MSQLAAIGDALLQQLDPAATMTSTYRRHDEPGFDAKRTESILLGTHFSVGFCGSRAEEATFNMDMSPPQIGLITASQTLLMTYQLIEPWALAPSPLAARTAPPDAKSWASLQTASGTHD